MINTNDAPLEKAVSVKKTDWALFAFSRSAHPGDPGGGTV